MSHDENDPVSALMREHREELRYEMPPALSARISRSAVPRRAPGPLFGGMAAAACVLVGFLSFQWGQSSGGLAQDITLQEVVSGHVRSLMANHLADVVSTDRHTVKPWFEGKLDFGPDVRDFAEKGFPLVGGRLDYIGNRAVAGLVYKHAQHVINLYEWPSTAPDSREPRLRTMRGYQLYEWRQDGLEYRAVSDINAADLQAFTTLLHAL